MDEETKEEKAEKKPRTRKLIEGVGIIAKEGESALVQWNDGGALKRGYVPAGEVSADGKCPADVLSASIPHGALWEEILEEILRTRPLTADAFATSLRAHGIWTAEDVERNPRGAQRAINAIVGVTIGALRRAAQKNEEE
jgi:hypothetical protein